jgi:hypothetical protein
MRGWLNNLNLYSKLGESSPGQATPKIKEPLAERVGKGLKLKALLVRLVITEITKNYETEAEHEQQIMWIIC